jgi:hypothetical protein
MSVTVKGYFQVATERAVLIEVDGEEMWFPFSQITDDSMIDDMIERDDYVEIEVSDWIAEQKGLAGPTERDDFLDLGDDQ